VESVLRTGSGFAAGPAPELRPEWVGAADDGTAEFRLAVAAALQVAGLGSKGERMDSVRRHWLPLDPKRAGRFASTGSAGQTRLQSNPDVVISGRSGVADAIALVSRRLIEAGQRGERHLPLAPARRASAHPSDLARLLSGEVSVDRTMQLARALMALDPRRWSAHPCPTTGAGGDALPDDAWLAIRLALLPWPLPDGRRIGTDPAIVRRLDAGDGSAAVELALRRLRAAGINAAVRVAVATPEIARLWAAALAFPISRSTAAFFARRLDPNAIDEGESA
jgi:CRISPR-associated protein Csx17